MESSLSHCVMGPSHTVDSALARGGGGDGGGGVLRSRRECEGAHSSTHSWFSICFNHMGKERTAAGLTITKRISLRFLEYLFFYVTP